MYEQKYNRYKFKYLCLQLQKGGYNPLRTNSMVLGDMKKKICDDEKQHLHPHIGKRQNICGEIK